MASVLCSRFNQQTPLKARWRLPVEVFCPSTASICCHQGRRGAQKEYVSFSKQRYVVCFFIFFFFFSSFDSTTTLRFSQTHNFADRQFARTHRAASDLLSVTCKWCCCCHSWVSMVSVVFRLVRSWLLCSSGFGLHLFVALFWLAEVGWGVRCSSTWSVLLAVMSGRGILCGPLGAGRWFQRGRRQGP